MKKVSKLAGQLLVKANQTAESPLPPPRQTEDTNEARHGTNSSSSSESNLEGYLALHKSPSLQQEAAATTVTVSHVSDSHGQTNTSSRSDLHEYLSAQKSLQATTAPAVVSDAVQANHTKDSERDNVKSTQAKVIQDQKRVDKNGKPVLYVSRTRNEGNGNNPLEFVHIPKTGGSAVEVAAGLQNITWGMCHYMNVPKFTIKQLPIQDFPGCNRFPPNHVPIRYKFCPASCWHMPPAKFFQLNLHANVNPYHGKNLFAIVRNPYSKMISEFYCPWAGYKNGQRNQTSLNNFLQLKLQRFQDGWRDDHLQSQAKFIFGKKSKKGPIEQVVDHVLFYEDMSVQLAELFESYNLNITLLGVVNGGRDKLNHDNKRMGVGDLNDRTIALINKIHRVDFEKLGYSMVDPRKMTDGWAETYSLESIYMA